jgi:hypothetical protein
MTSAKNPIRVYVTHAFSSNADYHRVFEYLESTANFFYRNCSVPDHPPNPPTREALKEEYRIQIKSAEVVVVLTSAYMENQPLTTYQMDVAQAANLPLIALGVFGSAAEIPTEIEKRAAMIVDWNERQIADAIRQHARGEETNRWDTIEFKL